ncbi:MAG: radical SAM protein [Leptotrichiaceae bacterium]|nr:radical SAM protein [Leptotrichiaceae bacterium]MBP9629709.1 radical SAM protein [Leptotrichiaceae bacterium]
MERYSIIKEKNPREIVLLKGFNCNYGKCSFCNYILDNTENENEMIEINFNILDKVTGEYSVLEVINSGSVFELNKDTLYKIKEVCENKNIKILYFEAYFGYLNRLNEIRDFFSDQEIRFIIGIETFDNNYRTQILNKNFFINDEILEKLKKEYRTALLLICTEGQTKEQIIHDIEFAKKNFKEVVVSIFINNGTSILRDEKLVSWFLKELYPILKADKQVEILIDNKDFGVYVQ